MTPKLVRIARVLGILSIVLGLIAVVLNAVRGGSLLGPGWIGVVIGLAVIAITSAVSRSAA